MASPRLGELDEYEKFLWRMNHPRVVADNTSSDFATLFKVDSSNRHGILLEVVQILTDLDLRIRKAYISSNGGWFMDVFHVTDAAGNKVTKTETLNFIEKAISTSHESSRRRVGVRQPVCEVQEHTVIEMTGTDRPGLMSEITAVLAEMCCNVVAAELWTHNTRVACLLYVTNQCTGGGPIFDMEKLARIKDSLCSVLKGNSANSNKSAHTDFPTTVTHTERRLHQLMFADRDYEPDGMDEAALPWGVHDNITVYDCGEKGYSVVSIKCRNRPKLVFDTLCTLTDMQYVVFHATIDLDGERACQEYYIRHVDGCILNSDAERRRVIQCLRAAIERRVSEGLRLELCTIDRVGLLSDVTRIFREHGLSVTRADVSTKNDTAKNVFYVTDAAGNSVDLKVIDAVRREMGQALLNVTEVPLFSSSPPLDSAGRSKFSLGNLFGMPSQVLYNLGLIKSPS